MKTTSKITLSAVISALSFAVMLASHFQYLTYAIPAIAGMLLTVIVIEIDKRYALFCYIVTSLLCLFAAEPSSVILYIGFFGYYPILKAVIEKLKKTVIEWMLKLLLLNCAIVPIYFASVFITGFEFDDFGSLAKYGAVIMLGLFNLIFVLYDIGIARVVSLYMQRLHFFVKKTFMRGKNS